MGDTFVTVLGIGTWFCDTLKVARMTARRVSRLFPNVPVTVVWCGELFCRYINGNEVR